MLVKLIPFLGKYLLSLAVPHGETARLERLLWVCKAARLSEGCCRGFEGTGPELSGII